QKNRTGSKMTARSSRTLSSGYSVTSSDNNAAMSSSASGTSYAVRGQASLSCLWRATTATQLTMSASPGGVTASGPASGRPQKKNGSVAPTSSGPLSGL